MVHAKRGPAQKTSGPPKSEDLKDLPEAVDGDEAAPGLRCHKSDSIGPLLAEGR